MPSQNQGYREQKVKTSNPLNAQENPSLDNVTVLDKASDWLKGWYELSEPISEKKKWNQYNHGSILTLNENSQKNLVEHLVNKAIKV